MVVPPQRTWESLDAQTTFNNGSYFSNHGAKFGDGSQAVFALGHSYHNARGSNFVIMDSSGAITVRGGGNGAYEPIACAIGSNVHILGKYVDPGRFQVNSWGNGITNLGATPVGGYGYNYAGVHSFTCGTSSALGGPFGILVQKQVASHVGISLFAVDAGSWTNVGTEARASIPSSHTDYLWSWGGIATGEDTGIVTFVDNDLDGRSVVQYVRFRITASGIQLLDTVPRVLYRSDSYESTDSAVTYSGSGRYYISIQNSGRAKTGLPTNHSQAVRVFSLDFSTAEATELASFENASYSGSGPYVHYANMDMALSCDGGLYIGTTFDGGVGRGQIKVFRLPVAGASCGGNSGPMPTVTLSASPTTVSNGEATLLSWSTTNATSCNASGNWSGSRGSSGSESSGSLTSANNTFTLSCSGAGGTTSATATVTVNGGSVSLLRPLQWTTGAGGNGHYYEFVAGTIDWTSAKTAAQARTYLGLSGHLATITSAAEQSFIATNLGADISPMHAWAGGYQDKMAPDYSEPSGGWRWVTGELFSYTNWAGGEPGSALEEYLMFYNGSLSYTWNDAVNSGYYYSTYYSSGYLVEYEGGPPTVTKNVTGTTSNNGWYTGDVVVNWVVDTRGYAEQSRQGCSSATINADTAGTVLSCSVTTAVGTANDSITIKRDATAPVATATPSPVSNTYVWHKGRVSVAFTGTDATSGIASCSDAVSVSTEGDNQTSS